MPIVSRDGVLLVIFDDDVQAEDEIWNPVIDPDDDDDDIDEALNEVEDLMGAERGVEEIPNRAEGVPNFPPDAPFRPVLDLQPLRMAVANARAMQAAAPMEKYMDNGPQLWNYLLNNIQEVFECEACVAGGAIRDYLLKIPANDIDVFVDIQDVGIIDQHMDELNWGLGIRLGNESYTQRKQEQFKIVGVWQFSVRGHAVQLIARPIPKENYCDELIKTFDFGIVQCYYTGVDEPLMYTSDAAKRDMEKRTFTLTDVAKDTPDISEKRFLAWQRRHGEFSKDWIFQANEGMKSLLELKRKAILEKQKMMEKLAKTTNSDYTIHRWVTGR